MNDNDWEDRITYKVLVNLKNNTRSGLRIERMHLAGEMQAKPDQKRNA
jgi:hypothetical protein